VEYPYRYAKGGLARKKYASGGLADIQNDLQDEDKYRFQMYDLQRDLYDLQRAQTLNQLRNRAGSFRENQGGGLFNWLDEKAYNKDYYLNPQEQPYQYHGLDENPQNAQLVQDYLDSLRGKDSIDSLRQKYEESLINKYQRPAEQALVPDILNSGVQGSQKVPNTIPDLNIPNQMGEKRPIQAPNMNTPDANYIPDINIPGSRGYKKNKAKGGSAKHMAEFLRSHPSNGPAEVRFISGPGKGQADLVEDDEVGDGSYVIDATTTAHSGDGSSKAGYKAWNRLADTQKYNHYEGGPIYKAPIVPARLSDSEIVLNPSLVSAIGGGSNEKGAKVLDKTVKLIRKHKASNGLGLPPKSKPISHYINKAKEGVR
jgi:hypothetical protein